MANQPELVECDARLMKVLGEKTVKLSSLSERIAPMLTRVPTPVLDYTIRCSSADTSIPTSSVAWQFKQRRDTMACVCLCTSL